MLHNRKKKVTAVVLCALLGMFGAHRFYIGYKSKAKAQLMGPLSLVIAAIVCAVLINTVGGRVASLATQILPAVAAIYYAIVYIWVFVDFIRILCNKLLPADGQDYIHLEGALAQSADELPESFVAADSGVVMIDQLYALYKKGAISAAQYTAKLTEFRSRM